MCSIELCKYVCYTFCYQVKGGKREIMNLRYYLNTLTTLFANASRKVKFVFAFLLSGIITYVPLYSSTLWDKAGASSADIVTVITTFYGKWWWIAFLIAFIVFIFLKDEKMKGIFKKIWIGVLVGFVVIHLRTPIEASLNQISTWFGGDQSTITQ